MRKYSKAENFRMENKVLKVLRETKQRRTVDFLFRAKTISKKTGIKGQAVRYVIERLIKKGYVVVYQRAKCITYKTKPKL